MNANCLLRMNIPPSLEEEFTDVLLANPLIEGYQCYATSGHGQVGAMSITEQVAGRRRRLQFEVVLDVGLVAEVLQQLKQALPLTDIVYWVVPVNAAGRFSEP